MSAVLLHGTLRAFIDSASDLPNMDSTWALFNSKDMTDAFVKVKIYPSEYTLAETRVVKDSLYPEWKEEFCLEMCHTISHIRFLVEDEDFISNDVIGYVDIRAKDLLDGREMEDSYPIVGIKKKKPQGTLKLKLRFCEYGEISDRFLHEKAYFDIRNHNSMRLYQDADTPNLPIFQGIENPDGSEYVPTRCWRDLFEAIQQAQKLIYIAGWSVDTRQSLLRGGEEASEINSNIGELLKQKAAAGVKVLLMIWNDQSSSAYLSKFLGGGMLDTHDEATTEYFANSAVQVANVHVDQSKKRKMQVSETIMSAIYTHHQKFVLVDGSNDDSDKRHLIAFLGGIDLTNGRFETPEYKLFDFAKTHGEKDFYQNCTPGATHQTGPRQPWHDIHCRVTGPITADVLDNFESRWKKQAEDKEGCLYPMNDKEFDLEYVCTEDQQNQGLWDMQLYRSITSDNCEFDRRKLKRLSSKLGNRVDNSIMRAYVQLIRQAQNFIYIENQYFLGSAYSWGEGSEVPAKHTIPNEIAHKIVSCIKKKLRFRAYIVIPLYPEGDPSTTVSQEILSWQHLTMKSMYQTIGNALQEAGSDAHPRDYLLFFSPGKSEGPDQVPDHLVKPAVGSPAEKACNSLRHPIYVHSKMMIVDDDFIILGSANINHRSLSGTRDTEIAIGASQPEHQASDHVGLPRGAIHTFRLALWSNHLGGYRPEFLDPASEECMETVKEMTSNYQEHYYSANTEFSLVHLLPYPIDVHKDGTVSNTPGWEKFPDTEGSVFGEGPKTRIPNSINYMTT